MALASGYVSAYIIISKANPSHALPLFVEFFCCFMRINVFVYMLRLKSELLVYGILKLVKLLFIIYCYPTVFVLSCVLLS